MSRDHYLTFDDSPRSDCGRETGQVIWFTPLPNYPEHWPLIPREAIVIRFPVERTLDRP